MLIQVNKYGPKHLVGQILEVIDYGKSSKRKNLRYIVNVPYSNSKMPWVTSKQQVLYPRQVEVLYEY